MLTWWKDLVGGWSTKESPYSWEDTAKDRLHQAEWMVRFLDNKIRQYNYERDQWQRIADDIRQLSQNQTSQTTT